MDLEQIIMYGDLERVINGKEYIYRRENMNRNYKYSLAVMVALLLTSNTIDVLGASVVPAGKEGPIIEQSANSIPIVQINAPNHTGLSHNQYKEFSVESQGLLLNNSPKPVTTEIAGYIDGNPLIGAFPAKQILNEVISTSPTSMVGPIEVAGSRADIIVANPNGININNSSFINTGQVTLTTGRPVIENGHLRAYNIQTGSIAVDGKGLDATRTPRTDILAESIKINAGLWANELNLVTGSNTVQADTLAIQSSNRNTLAGLDVASIGGMYANSIYLKGTQEGLGVNNKGHIIGSHIVVDVNGQVNNSGLIQSDTTNISTKNSIDQVGTIESNDITISSEAIVSNVGTIAGSDTLRIDAETITNKDGGKLYGGSIQLQGNTVSQSTQDIGEKSVIAATDSIAIGTSILENKGNSTIISGSTTSIGREVSTDGIVTGRTTEIINEGARINIGTNGNISANTIKNINTGYTIKQIIVGDSVLIDEVAGSGQPERYQLTHNRIRALGDYKDDEVVIYSDESDHLAVHGRTYQDWSRYRYHRLTKQDVIDSSNPGKITAGGNLYITANHIINDVSHISAAGKLEGNIKQLDNINPTGNTIYEDTGSATSYWRHHEDGTDSTGSRTVPYHNVTIIQEPIPASVYSDNLTTESPANVEKYSPMARIATNPTATYFIETDPAFTNQREFLSSDYFWDKLKTKPDYVQKRLGDGYYEQQLVEADILKQTGKSRLQAGLTAEEQYRLLMDAGIQHSIQRGWKLGIPLTEHELSSLEQDLVWLVEKTIVLPDGRTVNALVPVVYLANKTNKVNSIANIQGHNITLHTDTLINSGSIVADNSVLTSGRNIRNEGGLVAGNIVAINSKEDIYNKGTISANHSVQLEAERDIQNVGGQIIQTDEDGDISLMAKRNIAIAGETVNNAISTVWDDRNQRQEMHSTVSQGIVNGKGKVTVQADKDINILGSQIMSDDGLEVVAGHNVNIGSMSAKSTVKEDHYHVGKTGGGNKQINETHEYTEVTNQVKSSLSGANVTIQSGNALAVEGSEILAADKVDLESNKIQLEVATSTRHEDKEEHIRKKGIVSKEKSDGISSVDSHTVIGTVISGKDVSIVGYDAIEGRSVTALGEDHLQLSSKGNINIGAAQNIVDASSRYETKKSGLLSGGTFGFSIGKEQLRTKDTSHSESTVYSNLASSKGTVDITANEEVHMTSSNIGGQTGVSISGTSVTLDGNTDNLHESHDISYKKTGLTVSLGGIVPDAIDTTRDLMSTAKSRDDKRLAAFEINEARRQLQDNIQDAKDNFGKTFITTDKNGKVHKEKGNDRLLNVNLSLGSSSYTAHEEVNQNVYRGGLLTSKGDITIASKDASSKGINLVGEHVVGNHINLISASDIVLEAGKNETHISADSKSKGWSFGATFGLQGSGFMGLTASANRAKGHSEANQLSYLGTDIQAKEMVRLSSEHDTVIVGSKVEGEHVNARVGNDLTMTSLQREETYLDRSKSAGFSLSTGYSPLSKPNTSIGMSKGTIDSMYKSVYEQAGIYAGDGGYDISTERNTTLTGAIITSQAEANKNRLHTGALVMNDIQNEAHYIYANQGVQYKGYANPNDANGQISNRVYNQMGLTPNLSPGAQDSVTSTTNSAISKGDIVVDGQVIDSNAINTNTEDAVHTLNKIFDKKKIEERQELAKYFAQNAYEAVHRLGEQYGDPNDPNNPWRDGGKNKIAVHMAIAEITAMLAGNPAGSGAFAGAINEAAINKIIEKVGNEHPDQAQMLSALLGGVINKAIDKPTGAGSAVAQYGTKWNAFSDFYTIKPLLLGKSTVLVNMTMVDYAINTATVKDPGTLNERMFLYIGDGDELIIDSGHAYYRDHRSQKAKGLPSFKDTPKLHVLRAVFSATLIAEAGNYLKEGVNKTHIELAMYDGYRSRNVLLEVGIYKQGRRLNVSNFYPISFI